MIRLDLRAPLWTRHGGTHARGYAHLGERTLGAADLAAALDGCPTDEAWRETVGQLNGGFAMVTQREGRVLAAVDRIRTIPLFYAVHGGDGWLGDDAERGLEGAGSRELNAPANAEFRLTGYVTGEETLYSRVRQIQAGCLIRFTAATAEPQRYYAFHHGDFLPPDVERLIPQLETVYVGVFRRLLASVGGCQIVVPLSGGHDSRLIGVSLRDLGAKDVVCYSYGIPGNWESRISRELAAYLGFRWEFVPYSAERWRVWTATREFRDYVRSAGNLTSVPHIQDWPAVYELDREGRIARDSVLVPGHSGDFLAGSHVPPWFVKRRALARRDVLDAIQRTHYSLWDWPGGGERELREAFDRRIESIVGPIATGPPEHAADLFERWDLEERQAKFICNSVRVYESLGHEWRLPLFDARLMDFWARIPLELRTGRRLYHEFVRRTQSLPVTEANRDRSPLVRVLIDGVSRAGLRPVAKKLQRLLRRLRWQREYSSSALAAFALVDRDVFQRTYTGQELLHSYMALQYLNLVGGSVDARPGP